MKLTAQLIERMNAKRKLIMAMGQLARFKCEITKEKHKNTMQLINIYLKKLQLNSQHFQKAGQF